MDEYGIEDEWQSRIDALNEEDRLRAEQEAKQEAASQAEATPATPEPVQEQTADQRTEDVLEKSRQEGEQFAKDVYSGIGDFVFNDVPGAIEWATQDAEVKGLNEAMKDVQSWWQDVNPRSEIPAENIVRDLSSVILPSIYAPSAAVGAVGKATQAFNIGRRTRILGSAAASIGIDTTIAGISGTSARDQNLSRTLNDSFGWNIPWATRDDDSPDVMRKKNMIM